MKRSEVVSIIKGTMHGGFTTDEALRVLEVLDERGLLNKRYLTYDKHGLWDIHYGWEPEDGQ